MKNGLFIFIRGGTKSYDMTVQNIKHFLCPFVFVHNLKWAVYPSIRRLLLLYISQHGDGAVVKTKTGIRKLVLFFFFFFFFFACVANCFRFLLSSIKNHTSYL